MVHIFTHGNTSTSSLNNEHLVSALIDMANSHGVGDQNWSFYLKIKNTLNFPKLFPNIVDIMPESNATFIFQLQKETQHSITFFTYMNDARYLF